jgi:hypothetical protein
MMIFARMTTLAAEARAPQMVADDPDRRWPSFTFSQSLQHPQTRQFSSGY